MINPIYKFEITATYGQIVSTKTVYPIHKSDLAVDWQIEQNEQYYRSTLSGKLNFIGDDYDFINGKNFETEFELRIFISYNAGASWTQYWTGRFWKTDCEFDVDNKKITVSPTTYDEYNDVVAGLDKEYNLIDLAPAISHIKIDKRPLIQIYSPGESVVACFLSGMYWEQECNEISDDSALVNTYHFARCSSLRKIDVLGAIIPNATGLYYGIVGTQYEEYTYTNGAYSFKHYISGGQHLYVIMRNSDDAELWRLVTTVPAESGTITLQRVPGTGAIGNATCEISQKHIYGRYILDVDTLLGLPTYDIPANDIIPDNRNYHKCIGYAVNNIIFYSDQKTTTPTKYGLYQPGIYYAELRSYLIPKFYPVARSAWGDLSIWFAFSSVDWISEEQGRKAYTLKDAYHLSSVISVLLGQIAPNVKHEATTDYSQFLYGANEPITGAAFTLFLTQKSNILAGDYDQPAQKAPATLKMIMDMLRDCFRLYWFIDTDENSQLRFRIEHISWFLNGGSYSGTPVVGTDLTKLQVTRNGKPWAFDTSKYSYDKLQMPERYQFGWMDDVTELFDGYPIDIVSKFVQAGNIESINITNFTSDVDYMILNPTACDEDGFALIGASLVNDEYELPYLQFSIDGTDYVIQNAYMAFYYLQQYYMYDMPASNIEAVIYDDAEVVGTKKQKIQDIQYPAYYDPNLYQLVKTNMGSGQIEKLSINLSSRKAKATLRYDTEQ